MEENKNSTEFNRISIDELFERQSRVSTALKATLEPVPDEPDKVKITPWIEGAGCLCQLAINVPKAVIDSVSPTGEIHLCCGKKLEIAAQDAEEHNKTLNHNAVVEKVEPDFYQASCFCPNQPHPDAGNFPVPPGNPPFPFWNGQIFYYSYSAEKEAKAHDKGLHAFPPPSSILCGAIVRGLIR
jgi:hypothetical protein